MALPSDREHLVVSLFSVEMDTTIMSTNLPDDVRDVLERDQRTVITTLSRDQRRTTTTPYSITFWSNFTSKTTGIRTQS